jgi:hypothetical protein
LRTGCRDPKRVDRRIALLQVCKSPSLPIRNNTHISMRLTVMFLTQKFDPVTYNRSVCVLKARSLVMVANGRGSNPMNFIEGNKDE